MNVNLSPDVLAASLTDASMGGRERAEAVAKNFEQIFARLMVEDMRDSVGGDGMFGGGPGSGTYADWFDQHLSSHLTSGRGMGLADAMLRDWERNGWIQAEQPKGGINVHA